MKSHPTPIELRHILHKNPESSLREFSTTKILLSSIRNISSDLIIKTPLKTGLLVEYTVNSGDYLLFRADIDALPINEGTNSPFSSQNGFMHACGHDVHTSILYGLLIKVIEKCIKRNVLFLFQPGEEAGCGAKLFIESGVLTSYQVEFAFSLHVTDEFPFSVIASRAGTLFSASIEIDIDFIGRNAHITSPDRGIDASQAYLKYLSELERFKVNNRNIFFGIGKINIGESRNVLPGKVHLEGTIRGENTSAVENFICTIESIGRKVSAETGVELEINKGSICPELKVDTKLFEKVRALIALKFPFIETEMKLTSEDFGYFSKEYPSFYFLLGSRETERIYGLHSPYFYPPDSIIDKGVEIFLECLKAF